MSLGSQFLDLFGRGGGVANDQLLVIGADRVGDINHNFARQTLGEFDHIRHGTIRQRQNHHIGEFSGRENAATDSTVTNGVGQSGCLDQIKGADADLVPCRCQGRCQP